MGPYYCDDWPKMPDDSDFDGKRLLSLVQGGNSPFHKIWDVLLLIREIEENLSTQVIDIPVVSSGSNNFVSSGYIFHNLIPFSYSDSILRLKTKVG